MEWLVPKIDQRRPNGEPVIGQQRQFDALGNVLLGNLGYWYLFGINLDLILLQSKYTPSW